MILITVACSSIHAALARDKPGYGAAYSGNHDNLANDPSWMQCLHDIFPGESPDFYEKMKYAGCVLDSSAFLAKPQTEQDAINGFINNTLKKRP